ncbi:MAG TPA: histidine phosphatase family protein [Kiloniellales bacterium]|nr:histidine phosphatase family protein [Kiloniellales bacterium]
MLDEAKTTRWWWVRHAPVTVNEGRIYGQTDHICDCSDEATFRALARALPGGALWVTSNLKRTKMTAEAIHPHLLARPMSMLEEPALAEQHFGDWQGRSYEELRQGKLGHWHRFWLAPAETVPPGGESFVTVMERVRAAVERLSQAHAGRDIVAVTHGGTIRAALALALGLEPEAALRLQVANCSLTRIDLVSGLIGSHAPGPGESWRVEFMNLAPDMIRGA